MSWPVLSVTVFLPLVGALFIMALRGDDDAVRRNARWVALWTTIVTFAVSLILVWRFDPASPEFQFQEKVPWLGGTSAYHMGVDGISLPFVILTTALMPICIIASWGPIQTRVKEYMIAFLVLTSVTFSLFGFITGIWADGFEKLSIIPMLVVTPLTFLGGSFYSINMLPGIWRQVALFNPVVYLISGFRWSFFGQADVDVGVSLLATAGFLALCLAVVAVIFKTGWRLKS